MKKSLLLAMALFSSSVFAVEDVSVLKSDETQKKYERKAIIGLDIGISSRDINIPLNYCPSEGECRIVGVLHHNIDQNLENKIALELYDWLITQRFDKVVITPQKAYIITATEKIAVDNNTMNTFSFDTGDYKSFKGSLEKYLNTKLAPIVSKLMSSALKQRYQELPEKEKATFIKEKAKELGIPLEIAQKLMNSAFVFGVYFSINKPYASYTEKEITLPDGRKKTVYSTTIETPSEAKVAIFRFNADENRFVPYNDISGSSGIGTGESENYYVVPNSWLTNRLFKKSVLASAKSTGVNLNSILKNDDNFNIFATADEVSGKTVKADIGVIEDLRVDAPFIVREKVDGEIKEKGFIKARDVFKNCTQRGLSTFELVKGNIELKDQLREHPWTGLFIYGNLGMDTYEVTELAGYKLESGGGMFTTLKLGATLDLGYTLNNKMLSEVWFDIDLGLGFGGDALTYEDGTELARDPEYFYVGAGLYKRFYISSVGFFIAPGAKLAFQFLGATDNAGNDISVSSYSLKPEIIAGYNISPDLEIVGKVGWLQPLATNGKWGDTDVDATTEGGITFAIGINYHIKTVGPFVKLYTKPSTECRKAVENKK